jgi:hypothetical protein
VRSLFTIVALLLVLFRLQPVISAPLILATLPQLVGGVVTLVGLLTLLGRLQPLLPFALVLSSMPHILAERWISSLKYNALNERSRPAREMDMDYGG